MQPSTSVTFSLPDMSNMSDPSIHPFIKTLDDFASKTSGLGYQFGKNNHIEYTGVESSFTTLREKIIQFSFQLVRTSDAQVLSSVAKDTRDILNVIMNGIKNGEKHSEEYNICVDMGVTMFKLLAQTRDIIGGKGEYMLFYVMLFEWAKVDFRFFEYTIETLVYNICDNNVLTDTNTRTHPLGSWKDMKYLLTYIKEQMIGSSRCETGLESGSELNENSQLYLKFVTKIVNLVNKQLYIDAEKLKNGESSFSLVARWVPREKSKKFGWLYYHLAMNYSQHQIPSDISHPSYERAVNRAFMIYRRVISSINNKLDTTQIKQCNGKWSEINFDNVTSITMHKQTKPFLNLNKNGNTTRHEDSEDRFSCKDNYETYLKEVVEGGKKIKGKRVSIIDFVKSAVDCNSKGMLCNSSIITTLNEQWNNNSTQNSNLGNFIAMTDVSGSMTEENSNPLHSAIGLSIRVAEKSVIGPRIMTFSERPTWIQLGTQDSDTFVKRVNKVLTSSWGMTTNFYLALDLIREAIEDNNLPREVAENLVLVVFSDMQMNSAAPSMNDLSTRETLFENIKQMFEKMGKRMYGEPCKAPHIVFWNLRKTTGFPAISTDQNVSMMSGVSPALLNVFCEKGVAGLQQYTPWDTLMESLKNTRYKGFEGAFKEVIGF
jgi:hypothetical protein